MVDPGSLLIGGGVIALALTVLFEVTSYSEQQRLDERRRMQAMVVGSLVIIGLGAISLWYGIQGARVPLPLFVAINVAVIVVGVVNWQVRKRLDAA